MKWWPFGRKTESEPELPVSFLRLMDDEFAESQESRQDFYETSAWLEIAVRIIMRQIGRPRFVCTDISGVELKNHQAVNLFNYINPKSDPTTFWQEHAMWWATEGEVFWWFGPNYGYGMPREIYLLDPRKVFNDQYGENWWFFDERGGMRRLLADEFLHWRSPNRVNQYRGIHPIASMLREVEQDRLITEGHHDALKRAAIPDGLLKTDQVITETQAAEIQRAWEREYGRQGKRKRVAVLGRGTQFQALNQDIIKYMDLKADNRMTILATYGIPSKVANVANEKTALSGKDSDEQYRAFWSLSLIPMLGGWEDFLDTNFFDKFGAKGVRAKFDLTVITELQTSEMDMDKRLRDNIEVGLMTPNEARAMKGLAPVPWGNTWWRKQFLVDVLNPVVLSAPEVDTREPKDRKRIATHDAKQLDFLQMLEGVKQ